MSNTLVKMVSAVLLITIGLVVAPASVGWCAEKISRPMEYSGYSSHEWKGSVRSSEYVTMTDGTKLAVDIYLPSEYTGSDTAPAKFPVVLTYTPYSRGQMDPETGKVTTWFDSHIQFLASYGYATVVADMRGKGASYGWTLDFGPQIADDGKEIVDWIAAQPWSDGNVGMAGGSYVGWSQLASASRMPEALKCIMPMVTGIANEMFPGGIYAYQFVQMWSAMVYVGQRNYFPPFNYPTPPVIDEDGDDEFLDEIPVDKDGNGTFIGDYAWPVDKDKPPQYPDGKARTGHHYFNATMEHHAHPDGAPGNYDADSIARDISFIDAQMLPGYDLSLFDLFLNHIPRVMKSGIPVYHIGGWFDAFTKGSFKLYATMKDTNPSRVIMPPAYHMGLSQGCADLFGLDIADYNQKMAVETLRWYDRWLKGIENGIDKEPPVLIYVMNGEGWRQESEWPLSRQVDTKYYFAKGNKLAKNRATEGSDEYKADFTHNSGWEMKLPQWRNLVSLMPQINSFVPKQPPVSEAFYSNRMAMFEAPHLPIRTEMDKKCLTYTSDPLKKDTEVTGHPIVHVWVTSTAAYGDFYFYLEDVDEKGQAVLVTEYSLRAGFAGLHDNDEQIPTDDGIDVRPDLPWHGFKEADYVDGIFTGNNMVELVTDLHPTSWVFKKGHSIRVSIACADWPSFRLHPKLAPTNKPDEPGNIVPTIIVYRDEFHPSHIELPVIPH